MEKISSSFWILIICIAVISAVWIIGRNTGKNSIREEMDLLKADVKAAKLNAKSSMETDRVPKKRDFTDTESLESELKESNKSEN